MGFYVIYMFHYNLWNYNITFFLDIILYLKILNQADMQIDKYGNDVGYNKRLDDIESRYGSESDVFKKCLELVKSIKL